MRDKLTRRIQAPRSQAGRPLVDAGIAELIRSLRT